jgi:hypothetical protein
MAEELLSLNTCRPFVLFSHIYKDEDELLIEVAKTKGL